MLGRLTGALLGALLGLSSGGCTQPPVRWRESTSTPPAPTTETRLAVDGAGNVQWVSADVAPRTVPVGRAACLESLRVARATGQDEALDPERCALLHDGMQPLDDLLRSSGQYGPKVDVPDDADVQTRLLAFIGRDPR